MVMQATKPPARLRQRGTGITAALGVRGWSHLDAVLLAALATEAPLLLVGPHGTAKTLLVERIAGALEMSLRHYNAALLNYDDLVGIPLPTESGDSLRFIPSPATIWGAQFVFFDEISRCRADLQNKMFPVIHERRVVGIPLEDLHYRWAAMNPPAPDEPDANAVSATYYLGSEPLDPALTDRFPFIIPVPNWAELSKTDRLQLVAWDEEPEEAVIALADLHLPELVDACREQIPALEAEFKGWLADYVVYVVDFLERAGLPQSPRRARMLARSVVAIHAARQVLAAADSDLAADQAEAEDLDPAESAEQALLYGLPQSATEVPPTPVKVLALHRQAWELTQYLEDDRWRQVLEELDLARRVVLADQLDFEDFEMSRLITQTIGAEDSNARQIGLAVAIFLAFRNRRALDPSAFEPLVQLAYHVLEPRMVNASVFPNTPEAGTWDDIQQWLDGKPGESLYFRLERNFVLQGFPHLWRTADWKAAVAQFENDLMLFGIEEETSA